MCNGVNVDGQYGYVTTFFYPWYTSCFGSGKVEPKDTFQCLASEYARPSCDVGASEGAIQLSLATSVSILLTATYAAVI